MPQLAARLSRGERAPGGDAQSNYDRARVETWSSLCDHPSACAYSIRRLPDAHVPAEPLDDHVAWLPGAPGSPRRVAPVTLLPGNREVTASLLATFPVDYLRTRTGCEIAHPDLAVEVHRFLEERREDSETLWEALHELLRPGTSSPWPSDAVVTETPENCSEPWPRARAPAQSEGPRPCSSSRCVVRG